MLDVPAATPNKKGWSSEVVNEKKGYSSAQPRNPLPGIPNKRKRSTLLLLHPLKPHLSLFTVAILSLGIVTSQVQAKNFSDTLITAKGSAVSSAQRAGRRLRAKRIRGDHIKIDGRLDEAAWRGAEEATGFIQREPHDGVPATERTSVKVLYDDHALYIGVRAYDSEPEGIVARLSRRDSDNCPSDWIRIGIDSYHDHRTAFEFSVNPCGVKRDLIWFDDTEVDSNWDAVWEVKTRIDDGGWTAEFMIPLSQLRFAKNDGANTWGFQVCREILRKNEVDFWSPMPKDIDRVVSMFGELTGIDHIPSSRHLELLPYSVGSLETFAEPDDDPFRSKPAGDARIGADIKYSITSNMTMDITINPDFGQVEQDPSEVNLTAYESYFDEKRPFFMEGSNIFQYPIMIGDEDDEGLFYSRRIGRAPHFYPLDSNRWTDTDDFYEKSPKFTKILGAAKITGRTSSGWSIGVLEALTDKENAEVQLPTGERVGVAVEPMTNYFVGRVIKDFNNGRSTFGAIMTNVARDIPNEDLDYLNRTAFTGGVDFSHRWHNDEFQILGKVMASRITGSEEAILEAQTSSARYYQRPDAEHLGIDSTLTYMNGFAANLIAGKFAGGHWRYGAGYVTRSPGFEVNDLGYMKFADVHIAGIWGSYSHYEPGRVLREWHANSNIYEVWNYGGELVAQGGNINLSVQFLNYWGIYGGIARENEHQDNSLLRGGPAVLVPGTIRSWHGFYSDRRKLISFGYHGFISRNDEGFRSLLFSPRITIRPSGSFDFTINPSYSISENDLQYVDEIDDHYIVANLKMHQLSFTARLNLTLTPEMSLQFYGMPFVAAGDYRNFREVSSPRAPVYRDRFTPYDYPDDPDFNFKQFRSNLVFRWEYSPGSTIYLVWSRGATDYEEEFGDFSAARDMKRLFSTKGDNAFMIKINKWFSL